MKKVFLFCSLFFLLSCSNAEDSISSANSDFHPPTWIQGQWLQEGSVSGSGVLFSFSANDLCLTTMGITKQCQKELVDQMRKASNTTTVTETITDVVYTAEIKYFAGQSVIYSFKKLANNKIEWIAAPGSVFIKQ